MASSVCETVTGRWTRHAVQALERIGVDVRSLCDELDLDYTAFNDRLAIVDHQSIASLWSQAVIKYRDPSLGLRAAEHYRPVPDDMALHLLISCETIGEGVDAMRKFFLLAGCTKTIGVIPRTGAHAWRSPAWAFDDTAWVEFRLGLYRRFAELAAQREVCPLEVRFRHPDRGAARDLYARVFGCPVVFSALENEVVVPDAAMAIQLPTANDEAAKAIRTAANEQLVGPGTPALERRVRHLLSHALSSGQPLESDIARALHVSERTLKRRLAECGRTFSELLDDVRRRRALDLIVSTPLPFEAVASMVGYSAARSLTRAVKRWAGVTPAALREGGFTQVAAE